MTAGYELAAVQRREFGDESWETLIPTEGRTLGWIIESVIEDVLASPVLARVVREKQAEAWQVGWAARADRKHLKHGESVPALSHLNPYRDRTEEPT